MSENSEKQLIEKSDYSFGVAYESLPKNKMQEVRQKLMEIFNVNSNKSVYDRIYGRIEPKVSEAKAIEQLFKYYDIKMVWGEKNEKQ